MGKYVVEYNKKTESLFMEISGFFTEEDAGRFVNDFLKISKKIDVENTFLVLECGRLFLYPCDVELQLTGVFKMYRDTGYKLVRIKWYKPQKVVCRKVEQLAEKIGLRVESFFME